MPLGQRLVDKTKKLSEANKTIRTMKKDYQDLHDLYVAEKTGRTEAEDKLKLYQQGGIMYCLNEEDYVTEAIRFPAYHETTFEQLIPEDISRGYHKVPNGIIERDEEKYKKYIRRVI